jgi:hypothetical protein
MLKKFKFLAKKSEKKLTAFLKKRKIQSMAKKRSEIKLTPSSVIISAILSWATYLSVMEILSEYGIR